MKLSYLEKQPQRKLRKNFEYIQMAKEQENYYLRRVNEEFLKFTSFHGQPEGFSLCPHNMELHEIKMAQAASAGDYRLVCEIGEHYLKRAMAYVDLWRMRAWKQVDEDNDPPPLVDKIEVKSKNIPKALDEPGDVLPFK